MVAIAHPDTGDSIDVAIVREESHMGDEFVQIQATDDDLYLEDESGEPPWVFKSEVVGA